MFNVLKIAVPKENRAIISSTHTLTYIHNLNQEKWLEKGKNPAGNTLYSYFSYFIKCTKKINAKMSIEILLVRVQNVCVFVCIHLSIESFSDWLFWRLRNIQSILYDFEDCFNNWFLVKDKTAAINAVFSHSSKWQLAQAIIKHAYFSHFNLTICYNWPTV